MFRRITRYSAAADIELLPRGLLVVEFSGPLTAAMLRFVHEQAAIYSAPAKVRACVLDYTAAMLAFGDSDLDCVLQAAPDGSLPSLPAAIVSRPDCNGLFKRHALRTAARSGISRRVFNSTLAAVEWADEAATRAQYR